MVGGRTLGAIRGLPRCGSARWPTAAWRRPSLALRISGALPDLVALLVTPLLGGVPNPIDARGRAALGLFASRRVRIQGGIGLMRSFLGVVRL